MTLNKQKKSVERERGTEQEARSREEKASRPFVCLLDRSQMAAKASEVNRDM
jgi:hypothetical protein